MTFKTKTSSHSTAQTRRKGPGDALISRPLACRPSLLPGAVVASALLGSPALFRHLTVALQPVGDDLSAWCKSTQDEQDDRHNECRQHADTEEEREAETAPGVLAVGDHLRLVDVADLVTA